MFTFSWVGLVEGASSAGTKRVTLEMPDLGSRILSVTLFVDFPDSVPGFFTVLSHVVALLVSIEFFNC